MIDLDVTDGAPPARPPARRPARTPLHAPIRTSVVVLTVALMLAGFVLFGEREGGSRLNWSFAVAVIGSFFTLLAGIFSVLQLRASGVSL